MRRQVGAVLLLLAGGCGFDEQLSDAGTVASIFVENKLDGEVTLTSVASVSSVEGTFLFDGGILGPGGSVSFRVRSGAYDAIRAGDFIITGSCADGTQWSKAGKDMDVVLSESPLLWKATIAIVSCPS